MSIGGGIASVGLTPPGNGCPNFLDWGDGCVNNNTNSFVTHRYTSCGTFTITHTILYGETCVLTTSCIQTVVVSMSAATISLSKVQSPSECGSIEKLQATITSVSGCSPASQPVTISGAYPSNEFDVVGGDFSVNGNNVTTTVTAAEINQSGGKTVELWLRPIPCTDPTPINVLLTASANGMALSSTSQPFLCDPAGNLTTASLLWSVTPQAACLGITKSTMASSFPPGQPIKYTVQISNSGTGVATNVSIKDDYPDDLVPVNLPAGAVITGSSATWISSIPAGGLMLYALTFESANMCGNMFENCAEVTYCSAKAGPACITAMVSTGGMPLVQITGNMGVIAEPGIPAANLPSPPGTVPIIVEFAPFATLTINASYNFPSGSIFRMREGAAIVVRGGKLLSLQGKTKIGSCDKLWKGIKLENDASLFMTEVIVEDAQYVVNPVQDAWVWIENCDFKNNYIGLYAPEIPFYTIDHYLWSNTIHSDKPLKPMYAGQSPAIPQGGWGYAGIWIVSNSHPVIVGGSYADPSIFEGLVWGIYVNDFTDLTVFGTQFKNLTRSTYPNFTIGISAGTVWGSPVVSVKGLGKNDPKLTFDHCDIGILARKMQLDKVSDCRMENVAVGVWGVNQDFMRLKIEQNKIKTWVNGILFQNSPLANTIRIYDNEIDFHEGVPPLAYNPPQSGIYLFNCQPFTTGTNIELNTINARNTEFGGIHLVSSNMLQVYNNTANLYHAKTKTAGIYIEGGSGDLLSNNHCWGQDAESASGSRVSGIYASMHYKLDWCCNDVHNTRNGIFIDGECTYKDAFWGNSFDSHIYGLRFGPSGIVGSQISNQGNTWPSGSGSTWEAWHQGGEPAAFQSPFKVTQADPFEPFPANPVNIGTGKWFSNIGGNPFACSGSLICSNVQSGGLLDPKEIRVAEGTFSMPYHSSGSVWTAKRNLYARLAQQPSLMPPGSAAASFYIAHLYNEIGRLDALAQGTSALSQMNSNDAAAAENYYNTGQSLMTQIAAMDVQLATAPSAQYPALQAQKDALLAQYESNRAASEAFWVPRQQQLLNDADSLLIQAEAITTSTLQGANEKVWHRIYLSKLLRGVSILTAQELSDLSIVAAQCPLDGGNVVYAARGALEMLQSSPMVWPDNCGDGLQEGGGGERSQILFEGYSIAPNPTKGIILLSFPLSIEANRSVKVYDMLGTSIHELSLPVNESSSTLDLTTLSNGVYWLVVKEKGKMVFNTKIVKL